MAGRLRIRPLRPDDEPFLWEMLYHAIYVPEGEAPPSRDILQLPEIARYVEGWGEAADMGFLAVDPTSGKPAGAAWLRLFSGEKRGYGYVDDETPELTIAVLPEYRGQGTGSQLMERLLEAAGERFAAISLSVSPDNPAARLYRRLGFEVVSETRTAVTMMKSLGRREQ